MSVGSSKLALAAPSGEPKIGIRIGILSLKCLPLKCAGIACGEPENTIERIGGIGHLD